MALEMIQKSDGKILATVSGKSMKRDFMNDRASCKVIGLLGGLYFVLAWRAASPNTALL